MSHRSSLDLSRGVMEDLGLLAAGEDIAATDHEFIPRRYANIYDEMMDEQIPYWEMDAIPKEAFEGLVTLMGLVVEKSFGRPGLQGEEYNNALDGAKRRLRRRVVKPASGTPTPVDYF